MRYNIYEVTKAVTENGFLRIKLKLYTKNGEQYHELNTLDTLIVIKKMDVTKELMTTAREYLPFHISKFLLETPVNQEAYSYDDILNADSLFKKNI